MGAGFPQGGKWQSSYAVNCMLPKDGHLCFSFTACSDAVILND